MNREELEKIASIEPIEGMVVCYREWNFWNSAYTWRFDKIKKITPKGKIRLEKSNILIENFHPYEWIPFTNEMEKIFLDDKIRESVISMARYSNDIITTIQRKNRIPLEDIIELGEAFVKVGFEAFNWDTVNHNDVKYYKMALEDFNKFLHLYKGENNNE